MFRLPCIETEVGAAVQPDRQLLADQGQRSAFDRVLSPCARRVAAQRGGSAEPGARAPCPRVPGRCVVFGAALARAAAARSQRLGAVSHTWANI